MSIVKKYKDRKKKRKEKRDLDKATQNMTPESKAFVDMIKNNLEPAQALFEKTQTELAELGFHIDGHLLPTENAITAKAVMKPMHISQWKTYLQTKEDKAKAAEALAEKAEEPDCQVGCGKHETCQTPATEDKIMNAIKGANEDQAETVKKAEEKADENKSSQPNAESQV